MYKLGIVILGLLFFVNTNAQTVGGFEKQDQSSGLMAKADYDFLLGTQVGVFSGNSYYWSNYFSPAINWDLNSKFSISAGLGLGFTQFHIDHLNTGLEDSDDGAINQTSIHAYVMGSYALNPNLTVMGAINVEKSMTDMPMNPSFNTISKDVLVGFNYKIRDNVSFNAIMRISDNPRYNGYGYNPMNSPNNFRPGFTGFSPFY